MEGIPASNSKIDFTINLYFFGRISAVNMEVAIPSGIDKNRAVKVTTKVPYSIERMPNLFKYGAHSKVNNSIPENEMAAQLFISNKIKIKKMIIALISVESTT
jgi:hypothetical protein